MSSAGNVFHAVFFGRHSELSRYAVFGILNVIVTWVSYSLLVFLKVYPVFSNIASWVIGVTFAFVCNKFWVFESTDVNGLTLGREIASFVGGRLFTGAIAIFGFTAIYMVGLDQPIFGVEGLLAKILTSILEIVLNFVISKYLVFQKHE